MKEIADLSARERAKQYRELARDAYREADRSVSSVRECSIIAETWERLAGEAEAEATRQ